MLITKLALNQGIRVVLVLFHLKNIIQKAKHGKTVKKRRRISLSLTTARLTRTWTSKLGPMKNNSNERKTQSGKR